MQERTTNSSRNLVVFAFAFLFLIAIGLRVICALNDLWFDEIMSIKFASEISGWNGIFSEFVYDNNHYLNSYWLYALGPGQYDFLYRIPALLAGLATIVAASWAMKPYGKNCQQIAAVLIAFSYLQIHYSSEARGYALQILFAVLAFGYLERFHRQSQPGYAWAFGVFASLALLSHLLTINFLLACGFWSVSFQSRQPIPVRKQLLRITSCHVLPFMTGLALYYINVRFLQFGGGPRHGTFKVFASAWSMLIGVSTPGLLRLATGVFAFGLILLATFLFRRQEKNRPVSSESWKFFVVLLIMIPLARIAVPSSLLFTRYFLLQITFSLLLLSVITAEMAKEKSKQPLVLGFLVLFVALNLGQTSRLISFGRGSYQTALNWMAERTEQDLVTISTSNPTRDNPVIDYFVQARNLSPGRISITDESSAPEWFVAHETMDCAADTTPPPQQLEIAGHNYQLQYVFQASYLSGFEWSCYRKQRRSEDRVAKATP